MPVRTAGLFSLVFILAGRAALAQAPAAPPPPPPPLTGSVSAGLALTSGNTNTSSYNLAFGLAYDPKARNTVKADALFLRGKSNGVLNVDRTAFSVIDQYALSPKAFVFGQLQFLRDRFKDIVYLVSPTAGVGYKFVNTEATILSADAGVGGVWEKDRGLALATSGAVNASQKLKQKLSASAAFTEAVSGLWKTDDFGDALYTLSAGLELAMTSALQVKIEFLDTYKTRPPLVTLKKNDQSTIIALVYKFSR